MQFKYIKTYLAFWLSQNFSTLTITNRWRLAYLSNWEIVCSGQNIYSMRECSLKYFEWNFFISSLLAVKKAIRILKMTSLGAIKYCTNIVQTCLPTFSWKAAEAARRQFTSLNRKQVLRMENGSVTSRPFRKSWKRQTNKPTNRLSWGEVSFPRIRFLMELQWEEGKKGTETVPFNLSNCSDTVQGRGR